MLLLGTNKEQADLMHERYSDHFNYIRDNIDNNSTDDYVINLINTIKNSVLRFDITYLDINSVLLTILNKLSINYKVITTENAFIDDLGNNIKIYTIKDNSYEKTLCKEFEWIKIEDDTQLVETQNTLIEQPRKKLSFENLLDDNLVITEADERDFKETQNKLKVGMILQAKKSLNRILKLTNVLDKLYDELVDRMDADLTTTDTASLMYSADYISKALQDTNKLIMDLINNDKVQNFFIVDNTQNINIYDDGASIDNRERIRKAVEIVLDNLDLIESGEFDKLRNPNVIEADVIENNETNTDKIQEVNDNDIPTKPV